MSRGYAELPLPLTDFWALESWLYLSSAAALKRTGPVLTFPGSTINLVLVVWARESTGIPACHSSAARWHEYRGDALPPLVPRHVPPTTVWRVGHKVVKAGELSLPITGGSVGSILGLESTVEFSLMGKA